MQRYRMYIDGQETESVSGKYFDSYNPFTGDVWAQVAQGTAEDVDRAVRAAHTAMTEGACADLTASQRGLLLHRLGDLVARDARHLAETEVRDNGKLIAEMQGQLETRSIVGIMQVNEKAPIDKAHECQQVFKTTDPYHPGVEKVLAQGPINLAGPVTVLSEGACNGDNVSWRGHRFLLSSAERYDDGKAINE